MNHDNIIIEERKGNVMRKKHKFILFSIIIVTVTIIFQYYAYSTEYLKNDVFQSIQREYRLNLKDENWKYVKYEKNTIINKKEPLLVITNSYVNEIHYPDMTSVVIYATHGNEFINLNLPFANIHRKEMFQQDIVSNNMDISVKLLTNPVVGLDNLEKDEYLPIYVFDFYKDNIKYKIEIISPDNRKFVYHKSEQVIRSNELDACLNFINEILVYSQFILVKLFIVSSNFD